MPATWNRNRLTEKLGIDYSIVQGPLGGLSSQRLTAVVSNFGGLGSFGAHGLAPEAIKDVIAQIRSLTSKPFAMNLWVSMEDEGARTSDESAFNRSLVPLAVHLAALGAPRPAYKPYSPARFEDQARVLLDANVPVFSFICGVPPREILEECRAKSIVTIGTATTPDEATVLRDAGVNAIVASGFDTGASSGLGESTAKLLARHGPKVVLGARRKDRIDAVVKEISAAGGKAVGFAVDITKRVEVEALIKGAIESFGRVDVLVNNAGIMPIAPINLLKVEEWDRQIDINIKGVLYGVAAALPQMQKQKSGHIINLASVFGIKVFAPGGTVYCATKSAVRAFTEGLRMELHSENIRCTIISPGAVESELKNGTSDPSSAAFLKDLYKKIAIPADSVARAVLYAIEQPADVEIDEVVLRPAAQDF